MKIKSLLIAAACVAVIPAMMVTGCKKGDAGDPEVTVKLDRSDLTVTVGTPAKLNATVTPSGTPVWMSIDTAIATVSGTGEVSGITEGVTWVIVTVNSSVSDTCFVTVENAPVDPQVMDNIENFGQYDADQWFKKK